MPATSSAAPGAGNGNLTGQVYTVDKTVPTTAFDSTPTALTNSTSADFAFHGTDPTVAGVSSGVAILECSVDGAAFGTCTSPQHLTGLTDGPHSFDVRATDSAGNVGSSTSFSWTVDATAPVISSVSDSPDPTDTSSTISYSLSESVDRHGQDLRRLERPGPYAGGERRRRVPVRRPRRGT